VTREPAWRRVLRFWRPSVEGDVEDELRFHFDQRIDDLVRGGMPRHEAACVAAEEFGDAERVATDLQAIGHRMQSRRQRAGWWDAFSQDVQFTVRSCLRTPAFVSLAVITLALGIGANTALFAVADRIFFRAPPGVGSPERLHRLYRSRPVRDGVIPNPSHSALHSYAMVAALREVAPRGTVTGFARDSVTLGRGDATTAAVAVWYDADYFNVVGVRPALGQVPAATDIPVAAPQLLALISDAEWRRRYHGDSTILGRTIDVAHQRYTVAGVLPPDFRGVDVEAADYWLPLGPMSFLDPLDPAPNKWYADADDRSLRVLVRTAGADASALEPIATTVARRVGPDSTVTVAAGAIQAARGPATVGDAARIATRLAGIGAIVLLIACANVANLFLVRFMRRRRELAIRLSLGISRKRMALLLAVESLLVAGMSAGAALIVAVWGGAALRRTLLPGADWGGGPVDWRTAVFAFAVALAAGLVIALVPLLHAGRFSVLPQLRGGAREGGAQRSPLRAGLLVTQAALSVVLLVGAALFARSLYNVHQIRTGFDTDRLLVLNMAYDDGRRHTYDQREVHARIYGEVLRRARGLPGVERAAFSTTSPMFMTTSFGLYRENGERFVFGRGHSPAMISVSPNYFATTGTRVLSGREFWPSDSASGQGVVIVSAAAARAMWGTTAAIGQCLRYAVGGSPCHRVIGVVEEAHSAALIQDKKRPLYYIPSFTYYANDPTILLRVAPSRQDAVTAMVYEVMKPLLPAGTYARIRPLEEQMDAERRPWRLGTTLFGWFGALALILAAIGTYSVVSQTIAERLHEMAIRVALGAKGRHLLAFVAQSGVRLVVVGVALGLVVAAALGRVVAALLYETKALDPVAFVAATVILIAGAVVASLIPARRVLRTDPANVLRAD
jgi:putative ABC transport system permease protein